MTEVPFALAVAAGTLAALNPCGFALLPVYLTVLITDGDQPSRASAVARAMISTAAIVTGFVAVFALFGLALAPVAGLVQARLPWFTIVLGLALAGLGVWLLCGRSLPGISRLAGRGPVAARTIPSMAAFGAGYALTSLSCTIGPFLAIVVSSFRAGSPFAGVLLFLGYAAGMGMVVGIAALALALARTSVIGRMRRLAPLISRAGGVVIALAGTYVAYYGWYELRVLRGDTADDAVIGAALTVQGWFSSAVAGLGVPVVAFTFATVLTSAGAAVWWSRSRRRAVKQLR
jgi:cytochrome c-type biogenesis protein